MKQLNPEQIQENWKQLRDLITNTFSGERLENLNKMYDYFEDRMCLAPASGKEHYHNAMAGGYVEHVLHVTKFALELREMWERNGATIDFTDEELVFATLHHDLGKVGDLDHDYYILNESEWHRKNQGKIFVHNPKLQYMTVTDRAIWLLQHFNIPMNQTEYLGLRLTDGMYEEANKGYLVTYQPEFSLRSNISRICHAADTMATFIEGDQWKRTEQEQEKVVNKSVNNIKQAVNGKIEESVKENGLSKKHEDLFNELFGEN
jgi:predicted HD phosphohydrolase